MIGARGAAPGALVSRHSWYSLRPSKEVRMPTLVELFGKDPVRALVVADCIALIEAQVKQKGFVIKSAFATVKAIKKTFVPEVVDALLDDWLGKIQPHHDRWAVAKTSSFSEYVIARSEDVAEDLLTVTDVRAEKSSHTTARKMYQRMREGAKKNVVEAIPDLARLIERHMATASA